MFQLIFGLALLAVGLAYLIYGMWAFPKCLRGEDVWCPACGRRNRRRA